jgi:hypothetical protein
MGRSGKDANPNLATKPQSVPKPPQLWMKFWCEYRRKASGSPAFASFALKSGIDETSSASPMPAGAPVDSATKGWV